MGEEGVTLKSSWSHCHQATTTFRLQPLQNFQQHDQVRRQQEVLVAAWLEKYPAAARVLLSPVTGLTQHLTLWIGDMTLSKCFLLLFWHIGTAWYIMLLEEIGHDVSSYLAQFL